MTFVNSLAGRAVLKVLQVRLWLYLLTSPQLLSLSFSHPPPYNTHTLHYQWPRGHLILKILLRFRFSQPFSSQLCPSPLYHMHWPPTSCPRYPHSSQSSGSFLLQGGWCLSSLHLTHIKCGTYKVPRMLVYTWEWPSNPSNNGHASLLALRANKWVSAQDWK